MAELRSVKARLTRWEDLLGVRWVEELKLLSSSDCCEVDEIDQSIDETEEADSSHPDSPSTVLPTAVLIVIGCDMPSPIKLPTFR